MYCRFDKFPWPRSLRILTIIPSRVQTSSRIEFGTLDANRYLFVGHDPFDEINNLYAAYIRIRPKIINQLLDFSSRQMRRYLPLCKPVFMQFTNVIHLDC